jgi:hypothetical protein
MSKAVRTMLAPVVMLMLAAATAGAQEFEGRSRIELRVGAAIVGGTTTTTVGNIVSETHSVGALGAVAFSHWLREELAVTFSIGGWAVDIESSVGAGGVTSRTAVVAPLMGGVLYYFAPSSGGGFRPFASLTAGPVFGTESESSVGVTIVSRSVTRTAVGGRVGAGFDVPFAGSWIFGMFGGYTLMSDFSDPIGSEENHSAPDVGISVSWTWGGGS